MLKNLAVVGATGAVGRIVLQKIQQRELPYRRLKLLSSARSAGTKVTVNGESITVEEMTPDSFRGIDLVIASTPDEISAEFTPWARQAGAIVVD
ncbi:MAG: aspartate-semialdehyde dehydrogenase, partial [Planctomycetota bacterium]